MAAAQAMMQTPAQGRLPGRVSARPLPPSVIGLQAGAVVPLPGMTDALGRIGQTMVIRRNGVLQEAGAAAEYVYRVVDGQMRAQQLLPDGRRHVIRFPAAGDFVGFDEQGDCASTVEAITDCTVVRYPRRKFDALLAGDAGAGQQILRLICRQLSASNRMLMLLGRKTAAERMASFLLDMAGRRQVTAAADGVRFSLPMSRGDIADHLGLTVETVSRTFTQFRRRRLIALADRHDVVVLDRDALEEIAGD